MPKPDMNSVLGTVYNLLLDSIVLLVDCGLQLSPQKNMNPLRQYVLHIFCSRLAEDLDYVAYVHYISLASVSNAVMKYPAAPLFYRTTICRFDFSPEIPVTCVIYKYVIVFLRGILQLIKSSVDRLPGRFFIDEFL